MDLKAKVKVKNPVTGEDEPVKLRAYVEHRVTQREEDNRQDGVAPGRIAWGVTGEFPASLLQVGPKMGQQLLMLWLMNGGDAELREEVAMQVSTLTTMVRDFAYSEDLEANLAVLKMLPPEAIEKMMSGAAANFVPKKEMQIDDLIKDGSRISLKLNPNFTLGSVEEIEQVLENLTAKQWTTIENAAARFAQAIDAVLPANLREKTLAYRGGRTVEEYAQAAFAKVRLMPPRELAEIVHTNRAEMSKAMAQVVHGFLQKATPGSIRAVADKFNDVVTRTADDLVVTAIESAADVLDNTAAGRFENTGFQDALQGLAGVFVGAVLDVRDSAVANDLAPDMTPIVQVSKENQRRIGLG